MVDIVTRAGKGSPLTNAEVDTNFTNLATAVDAAPAPNDGTLTMAVSGTGLSGSASFSADQADASSFTVTSNATSANTASAIVARDGSGNFSAGTITAALSGNATTATTLQTSRTIGGVSFNGSANINLPGVNATGNQNTTGTAAVATEVSVTNDGVSATNYVPFISGNTTGDYALKVDSGLRYNPSSNAMIVSGSLDAYAVTADSISLGDNDPFAFGGAVGDVKMFYDSVNNTMEMELESDANSFIITDNGTTKFTFTKATGDISATTFSGALSGNSTTATTLQIARTIGGVSFDGSANINLPGVNAAGNQNTSGNAATATNVAYSGLTGAVPTWNQNTTGNAATATNVAYSGLTGAVPTWNQNTTGNAATATALATARTIGGVSFNGTANINLPGVNTAGNQSTSGNAATATTAGAVVKTVTGTSSAELVRGNMADSDQFRILVGGTATNAGYAEIATADDGTEPIYVRQYTGTFTTLQRTATLLDGSGNTSFPNTVTAPTFSGALSGNATTSSSTTGNAATATTLQTARTIGGVSFNGSANINLPGVNTAGNQNTSGTAAVSTTATVTTSATASAFKVPFANTTASTTGNYGLLQDSTATFTYNPSTNTLVAGTFSGALSGNATTSSSTTGNAATATTLQTARTINGVSFNGSANITVADGTKLPTAGGTLTGTLNFSQPVGLGFANGQYIKDNGTGGLIINSSAAVNLNGTSVTVNGNTALHAGNYNSYSPTLTGGNASGTWGISVTGNAATATTLQTARTIGGVSFNGSASINLPGVNAAGNQNTSGSSASCTGNAATATALATARTIGGVSFNGTANINLPGVNAAGNQNTSGSSASCTGNAATVTNATFIRQFTVRDDRSDGNNYSLANRPTGLYAITAAGTNGPGSQYSSLIHVANGGDVAFQIAGGYNSDAMYFRGTTALQNGTGYSAWRTVLHNGNYNSYAPTLTGGGASGSWGISVTGNAATATTLQTARTIGGVSFNGSANINLPGVNAAGNQSTTGNAATATTLQTARTINGTSFNGSANITVPANIATSATASAFKVPFANTTASTTGNYGLLQDSTATFTYNPSTNTLVAGTFSGALSGNATTATTLQTARTIGGVSFNGSANINLPGVNAQGNQNTTGNAATCTNATNTNSVSNATGGAYTWTGAQTFQSNLGETSGALTQPPLQVYSTGTNSAFMSFHRGGSFAVNMGLDSDNVLRIGGWSASTNRLQLDMSGNLTMAGNVTAYSDERLKKDWEEVKPNFVDQLANVKSGTYTRTDSDERQAGVSAQSLQELLPETVAAGNDGMLSVAYGNAAMVAVVELAKEVRKLKEELRALKGS